MDEGLGAGAGARVAGLRGGAAQRACALGDSQGGGAAGGAARRAAARVRAGLSGAVGGGAAAAAAAGGAGGGGRRRPRQPEIHRYVRFCACIALAVVAPLLCDDCACVRCALAGASVSYGQGRRTPSHLAASTTAASTAARVSLRASRPLPPAADADAPPGPAAPDQAPASPEQAPAPDEVLGWVSPATSPGRPAATPTHPSPIQQQLAMLNLRSPNPDAASAPATPPPARRAAAAAAAGGGERAARAARPQLPPPGGARAASSVAVSVSGAGGSVAGAGRPSPTSALCGHPQLEVRVWFVEGLRQGLPSGHESRGAEKGTPCTP